MNYQTQKENAVIALELYREYQKHIEDHIKKWYKIEQLNDFERFCEARIAQMEARMQWYMPL